jgi:hypothetical protein
VLGGRKHSVTMSEYYMVFVVLAILVYINMKASEKQTTRRRGNQGPFWTGKLPKKEVRQLGRDKVSQTETTAQATVNPGEAATQGVTSQDAAQPDDVSFSSRKKMIGCLLLALTENR